MRSAPWPGGVGGNTGRDRMRAGRPRSREGQSLHPGGFPFPLASFFVALRGQLFSSGRRTFGWTVGFGEIYARGRGKAIG